MDSFLAVVQELRMSGNRPTIQAVFAGTIRYAVRWSVRASVGKEHRAMSRPSAGRVFPVAPMAAAS